MNFPWNIVLRFRLTPVISGGSVGKLRDDLFGEIGLDDFVRVQAHHPIGGDWSVLKRPLKLLGLVPEWMLKDVCARLLWLDLPYCRSRTSQ